MKKMDFNKQTEKHREGNTSLELGRRESLSRLVRFLKDSLPCDILTFKGGLFLGEYTGRPRYTQDVDASIISQAMYPDVYRVLTEFGEQLIAEGSISKYSVADQAVAGHSGGAKYYDLNGRVALSIDISLHGAVLLDTAIVDTSIAGRLRLTTVEQIVCDKLTVCFTKARFRRTKDLYDLWLILQTCSPDVDRVRWLLEDRGAYPLPLTEAPFCDKYIAMMEHAYEKFILRDPYNETEVKKPSFVEVVHATGSFMSKFMRDDT